MTRITLALTAALALAAGTALAAPKSYEVPEPTATLRAPKAGTHAEGFEAARRTASSAIRWTTSPCSRRAKARPSGSPR